MTLMKAFTLLLLFALASTARAQASPDTTKVSSARLLPGEKITLDGSLDHPAWKRAPVYKRFVERAPNHGAEPQVRNRPSGPCR